MDDDVKVALVTGAARGLGRATAEALAADGIKLFLVDILAERLEETRLSLVATGAQCKTMVADLSMREACQEIVEATIATYGRLDILCNVAGILKFHHVQDVTEQEWDALIAINLSAPFWISQAAIPHLFVSNGNIVNVASLSAVVGTPYIVPYAATKAALVEMTRAMAMEYIDQPIRINTVAPGTMPTEISQGTSRPVGFDPEKIRRYAGLRPPSSPEEVAGLIAFIASDKASAIHGALIHADGGASAG